MDTQDERDLFPPEKDKIQILMEEMEKATVPVDEKLQVKADLLFTLLQEEKEFIGARTVEDKQERDELHKQRERVHADVRFLQIERFAIRRKFEKAIKKEKERIERMLARMAKKARELEERREHLGEQLQFNYKCCCPACHAIVPAYRLPPDKRPERDEDVQDEPLTATA
jgi:phosphoenolpyruvate synthase/pyruvate phosphate dikinase